MPSNDETRLIFKGISTMGSSKVAGVIILTDVEERSQISFLCDNIMESQFEQRFVKPVLPYLHLPEALLQILKSYPDISLSMHVMDVRHGDYVVFLTDEHLPFSTIIRASDAALLSFISDIPLYIDNRLFKMQSTPYKEGSSLVSIPINIMSDKMLQKALNQAVKEENYELASFIKTEQERRGGAAKKQ